MKLIDYFMLQRLEQKKRLFLFFNITQKDDGQFRTESGSFLDKLWPHYAKQSMDIIHQPPVAEIPAPTSEQDEATPARLYRG